MIQKGEIIQSSWGATIYRVKYIKHNCTCPSYLDSINMPIGMAPPQPPHCHMTLETVGKEKHADSYINYIDELSLENVTLRSDRIEVLTRLSVATISLLL